MLLYTALVLPLLNGIFGWVLVGRTIYVMMGSIREDSKSLLGEFKLTKEEVREQLASANWEEELESVIDLKLQSFIEGIKKKIPMASMFLTSGIVDTLKATAKEEVLASLPELQDVLAKRIVESIDLGKMLDKIDWESIFKKLQTKILFMKGVGALGGVLLGCIEISLLLLTQ